MFRLEERQRLAGGAYRHQWHVDYPTRAGAVSEHAVLVAEMARHGGMYGPDGPRRLVVTDVGGSR